MFGGLVAAINEDFLRTLLHIEVVFEPEPQMTPSFSAANYSAPSESSIFAGRGRRCRHVRRRRSVARPDRCGFGCGGRQRQGGDGRQGQGRPVVRRRAQRPVPLRQRQEVQAVPRRERVAARWPRTAPQRSQHWPSASARWRRTCTSTPSAQSSPRSRRRPLRPASGTTSRNAQVVMAQSSALRDEISAYDDDRRGAGRRRDRQRVRARRGRRRDGRRGLGGPRRARQGHRRARDQLVVHRGVRRGRCDPHDHARSGRPRGPGLGRDALQDVREVRREQEVEGRRQRRHAGRRAGARPRGVHHPRAQRLRHALLGGRRAPARAHQPHRREEAPPDHVRRRRGAARAPGRHRGRHPRRGPAHRRLPLQRPRRPERQHDRLGGAHHAHPDRVPS